MKKILYIFFFCLLGINLTVISDDFTDMFVKKIFAKKVEACDDDNTGGGIGYGSWNPCPYVIDGTWAGSLVNCGTNTIDIGFYSRTEKYCTYRGMEYLGIRYTGIRQYGFFSVARC